MRLSTEPTDANVLLLPDLGKTPHLHSLSVCDDRADGKILLARQMLWAPAMRETCGDGRVGHRGEGFMGIPPF